MTRRRIAAAATFPILVLAGCGLHNPDGSGSTPPTERSTTSPSPAPPGRPEAPTPAQINRQDHPSAGLVRSQEAAVAARPMLPALPITTARVTIAVGGLAADGRTTILTLMSRLGRAHVLAVYRHELRVYGDTGRGYQPVVQP